MYWTVVLNEADLSAARWDRGLFTAVLLVFTVLRAVLYLACYCRTRDAASPLKASDLADCRGAVWMEVYVTMYCRGVILT